MTDRELIELAGETWALDYDRTEVESLLGFLLPESEWEVVLTHWVKLDEGC